MKRTRRSATGLPQAIGMWVAVIALILAPVLIALTHAPSATVFFETSLAHGHAHNDGDTSFASGHDATDHEHQSETVLPVSGSQDANQADVHSTNVVLQIFEHSPQSLRRPPRLV